MSRAAWVALGSSALAAGASCTTSSSLGVAPEATTAVSAPPGSEPPTGDDPPTAPDATGDDEGDAAAPQADADADPTCSFSELIPCGDASCDPSTELCRHDVQVYHACSNGQTDSWSCVTKSVADFLPSWCRGACTTSCACANAADGQVFLLPQCMKASAGEGQSWTCSDVDGGGVVITCTGTRSEICGPCYGAPPARLTSA